MRVMKRTGWTSSPGFEILTFANEILNCCNRYQNEPVETEKNSLDWWRAKKEEYPTLVRLARKYLCVPGTSTQAERVFSWMGWLLNKRRLSMSGETVSMQLFLKDNLVL